MAENGWTDGDLILGPSISISAMRRGTKNQHFCCDHWECGLLDDELLLLRLM